MNTSFTTLLTIAVMFVFVGEVIRGFLFALLIGIGIGTYSSVFIATPILYDTTKDNNMVVDDDKKLYKGGKKKDKLTEEPAV